MTLRIPRRFDVIRPWLEGRKRHRDGLPAFLDLCRFLTQPSAKTRGMRFVRSIDEETGVYAVSLKGHEPLVYWPASRPLWSLGMLLSEQFNPTDWHYYQVPETKVGPDDVVVDCGAAEGLFSIIASSVCKHCYCVEPSPSFLPLLRRTFEGVKNVEIVPVFLSDHVGETHMTEAWGSSKAIDTETGPSIPVSTVDSTFFDRNLSFTYLKADIEGAEMQLLEGAKKSIAQFRPKIAITTYHDPVHADQIRAFLRDQNPDYHFRVKGIVPGGQPVMLHAW
jgi:FkbM family methyltransferase